MTTGFVVGLRWLGWLQPLELISLDYLVSALPKDDPDPRLLIVGITESDIQQLNQWPISDQIIADTLAALQAARPKAIGLDIYRDIPHEPGHAALTTQLQAPNIIAIETFGVVPAPPSIPREQVGFNDFVIDPDGPIRRNLLFTTVDGEPYYSFSLRLSLAYLADSLSTVKAETQALKIGPTEFPAIKPNSGGYQGIDNMGYQILMRYQKSDQFARQVTLVDILEGNFEPDWITDKVVLIGAVAPSAKDSFLTPGSRFNRNEALIPGVLIHAYSVSQLLSTVLDNQALYRFSPDFIEILWIWILTLTGAILAWRVNQYLLLTASVFMAVISAVGVGYGAILLQSIWIPVVAPILGVTASSSLSLAYKRAYDSTHDTLTGLLNREQIIEQIGYATSSSTTAKIHIAVFVVSLNRLNIISESLGFRAVDKIAQLVADRLIRQLPKHTPVARIGADQFSFLLTDLKASKDANTIANNLIQEIGRPFLIQGKSIFLNCSIGIAITEPGYKNQPADLLRDAHTAMYRAQTPGASKHAMFVVKMREEKLLRMQLESDLSLAVERQEFFLTYQPIICFKTGRIAGFEALVRWQHPEKGLISPADFIPVAEETGLIVPLGKWIMETACQQLAQWQNLFADEFSLLMSINLSPGQFSQPDLVEQIQAVMESMNIDGRNIKLEITESMLMDNIDAAIDLFLRLKMLNLKLGIDDFGTGYSSLSYLSRFPVDTLKVDRSFVCNMENVSSDAEIVRIIVMLGHTLNMDIIAEGVETQEQFTLLDNMGCEYAQGYFMSKPIVAEQATLLLRQNPQWS